MDVWAGLFKDPDQGLGLSGPKKDILLPRQIVHALERSLRLDLMILNSLDLFHRAFSVNYSNLVKLVYQTDSYFSPWTKRRSVSKLASDKGDRLWWRIGKSEKICFQLFSESRDTSHSSNG